ncbi:hypothetical protein [Haloechinothrix sp. LS1_15]|uniref:hypothetical protein n=1 Tax=Haloechinothrix sp. LS1_15 TaxID=2652248 RepID=UPI00294B44FE|nr:hypothetical protein [Haloechinothrix sp. LS1_15]
MSPVVVDTSVLAVFYAAHDARHHLAGLPLRRMPIAPLLDRIWELRDTITVDGAAYVALAERIDGALLTCDGTLGAATGPRCAIDVIT